MVPVRVRGKKYRKKPTASKQVPGITGPISLPDAQDQLQRSNSELERPNYSHKPVRIQGDSAVTQPTKALSAIERLPVEILEFIFFQNLNLSFPRASPVLGRKLASLHVKNSLVFTVFPSDDGFLVNKDFLAKTLGSYAAVGNFQSQILALKWMTLEFLEYMLEEYTVRTIARLFNQYSLGWVDLERPLRFDESHILPPKCSDVMIAYKEANVEGIRSFYKQHALRFKHDKSLKAFQQWRWRNDSVDKKVLMGINFRAGRMFLQVSRISAPQPGIILNRWSRALECIQGCRIPQNLLHGPWSSAKCVQLEHILRGNGGIDFSGATTDEEVAARGLRDALAEHNVRAIHVLIGRAGIPERDLIKIDDLSAHFSERALTCCHQCVGVVVTTEHFKFALDKECSTFILRCLADAIYIRVNWQDKAITSWAVRKRNEGDERGEWLWNRLSNARIDFLSLTKG